MPPKESDTRSLRSHRTKQQTTVQPLTATLHLYSNLKPMKKVLLGLIVAFISQVVFSTFIFSQGTWVQKASLPAAGRSTAVAFSIGNKGYLGTGYDGNPTGGNRKDFWEYDPSTDSWTQKADFGAGPRSFAVGFSIGNYGYIGTGNGPCISCNDFWKYDPNLNSWTQIANFGGAGRDAAFSFSINGKGYVGTGGQGVTSPMQDLWEYDTLTNTWTQLANYIGLRSDIDRATFVINNKAYVGTGNYYSSGFTYFNDIWEYDPLPNIWTQKANLPAPARQGATGFSIDSCNKGFLGLGGNGSSAFNDLWMYDPSTNTWSAVLSLPASGRVDQPAFVINNKAYIGTGKGFGSNNYLNDLWEYTPNCEQTTSIEENAFLYSVNIFPNPFSFLTTLQTDILLKNATLTVYNCFGQTVAQIKNISGQTVTLHRDNLPSGLYFVRLTEENKTIAVDKLVITDN